LCNSPPFLMLAFQPTVQWVLATVLKVKCNRNVKPVIDFRSVLRLRMRGVLLLDKISTYILRPLCLLVDQVPYQRQLKLLVFLYGILLSLNRGTSSAKRPCVTIRNRLFFTFFTQCGGPPFVGCLLLLIQYIHSPS
jgi:hypothetical protein